jgi:hypothetical protein
MTKRPFPFLKFFFVPNNLLDLIVESFSVLMFGEVASCIGGVRFSWGAKFQADAAACIYAGHGCILFHSLRI